MKHLLIIALVLLGSVTTSCKKNYSCKTTISTVDPINTFSETHDEVLVTGVTKGGLQDYKSTEINKWENFNNTPHNVDVACEVIK